MLFWLRLFVFSFLFPLSLWSAQVKGKILVCGVCKNVAGAIPAIMRSMESCGKAFEDYRIVVYENDSCDGTAWLLKRWAEVNPKVILRSERLTKEKLLRFSPSGRCCRTEIIAYARNCVLDVVCKNTFSDYEYVIMADMDFVTPWDIDEIVATINSPTEWDAVFANGILPHNKRMYDMFAYRDRRHPIGPELTGQWWWIHHGWFTVHPSDPWLPVYSAFNGLGIYKRKAILGCRYSGGLTENLEREVKQWLAQGILDNNRYATQYPEQIKSIKKVYTPFTLMQSKYAPTPETSRIVISDKKDALLWPLSWEARAPIDVCEHLNLHADMAQKGHRKLYVNPRLIIHYPGH